MRNIWYQAHWFLGITAGTVLAVVGFTGGMMSFEDEILRALNPGIISVTPQGTPLAPAVLMAHVQDATPGKRITAFTVSSDPATAARVVFAPPAVPGQAAGAPSAPGGPRGETRYVDPYTGEVLPPAYARDFFQSVEQLHRRLLAGDVGKQIVGFCTLCLLVLALSGLYLRWPRDVASWRAWLTFDTRRKGRPFLWCLHSVAGTWVLLFYLVASLTGVVMSYEGVRNGLYRIAGVPRPNFGAGGPGAAPAGAVPRTAAPGPANTAMAAAAGGAENAAAPMRERTENKNEAGKAPRDHGDGAPAQRHPRLDLAGLWAAFDKAVPAFSTATLRIPAPGQPVQFTYMDPQPQHDRAFNRLSLDPATLEIKQHDRYADRAAAAKLLGSMFPIHSGEMFGWPVMILMMLAALAMPLFPITGWMLYLARRRARRANRQLASAQP